MNLKHSSLCGLLEFHKMNLAAIIKPNNNKKNFFLRVLFLYSEKEQKKEREILERESLFIFKIYRSSSVWKQNKMISEFKLYTLH